MVVFEPASVSPRLAGETLDEVTRLRRHTRRSLDRSWFPLVCFGALTMLSAPLVAAYGVSVLAPLWIVAGAAGMLLTRRHYRLRGPRHGVTGRGRQVWRITIIACPLAIAAGIVGGTIGGATGGVLAPTAFIVLSYVALGWVQRDPLPSLALAPGALLAIAGGAAGMAPWLVELTFGTALVAAGAGIRLLAARS